MTAQELRIRNWVLKTETNEQTQVFGHGIAAFALAESVRKAGEPQMYSPIELTPEWLQRAGARRENEYTLVIEINSYMALVHNKYQSGVYVRTYKDSGFIEIQIPCDFVHQLQNIYHSLTGTELDFD